MAMRAAPRSAVPQRRAARSIGVFAVAVGPRIIDRRADADHIEARRDHQQRGRAFFTLFVLVTDGNLIDPSRSHRIFALAVLASLSMFTHNMLEFPYWLLTLALLTSV